MKYFLRILFLIFLTCTLSSWGFFAHKQINKMAVFTLPPPLAPLYKKHIDYLSEHAVDPDKRRYANEYEAARHYIDVDAYGITPFDSIPKYWGNAVDKYSEDTVNSRGIVPWQIERSYKQLIKAFESLDIQKILRYSADLGHYIADANVPLHTTHNYNGQLTNQVGIHAFWESRLPELFSVNYDFIVGRATYIADPLEEAWNMVKNSFSQVDTLLKIEASLSDQYPKEKKYAYEYRLQTIDRVYSKNYSKTYHQQLNGMVEQQMKKSVKDVGNFWYSAWVDAGQPDVTRLLDNKHFIPEALPDSIPIKGKTLGRQEWQ